MASIIPQLLVEVIATVSGVIISIGIPLILTKLNKFGKVYTTVFGVEDVETMSGLVGVVETHDEELEDVINGVDELRQGQAEIQERVASIERSVMERNGGPNDS